MYPPDPTIDANFLAYAGLLWRHHLLTDGGDDAGPERDNLEDEMDALWERLDEAQRRALKGMGSDLNWLGRKGERTWQEPPAVVEAEQGESQPGLLGCLGWLRYNAVRIPRWELALNRSRLYGKMGLPDMGAAFEALGWELVESRGMFW